MKGTTRIELTNVKTGEKQVVEEHNLVTNAVKDILQANPYGVRYKFTWNRLSTTDIPAQNLFFPLYEKMFGGLLIYKTALVEDATRYYQAAELTGYADNSASPGTDAKRGSRNLTESGPVTGGYKYVWDFSTSQGNGTISALALTNVYAGAAGWYFKAPYYNDGSYITDMLDVEGKTPDERAAYELKKEGMRYIGDDGVGISVMFADTKKIVVRRYKTNLNQITLMNSPFDELIDETEITTTIGEKGTDSTAKTWFNAAFVDGGDDYIWGFQFAGNLEYTGTSPTLNWIKIKKSDFTFTEGSTVLTGCTCWRPGIQYRNHIIAYDKHICTSCLVKDGYLYLIGKDKTNLYKISLSNMADIIEIQLPAACSVDQSSNTVSYQRCVCGYSALNLMGDLIYGDNFYLVGNNAYAKKGDIYGNLVSAPHISNSPYVVGIDYLKSQNSGDGYTVWGGSYRYVGMLLNYQGTINNLTTPVLKTAQQTMKITYTLTEV